MPNALLYQNKNDLGNSTQESKVAVMSNFNHQLRKMKSGLSASTKAKRVDKMEKGYFHTVKGTAKTQ